MAEMGLPKMVVARVNMTVANHRAQSSGKATRRVKMSSSGMLQARMGGLKREATASRARGGAKRASLQARRVAGQEAMTAKTAVVRAASKMVANMMLANLRLPPLLRQRSSGKGTRRARMEGKLQSIVVALARSSIGMTRA